MQAKLYKRINFILGSQSPAKANVAVVQDHRELVVSGFGFLESPAAFNLFILRAVCSASPC